MPELDDELTVQLEPASSTVNEGRANAFIARRKAEAEKYGSSFEEIAKQRRVAIEEAKATLDATIAEMRSRHTGGAGGINLPLLSFGAGMLQGSPPGVVSNFGQELGRGLSSMGQTIRAQRMSDVDFLRGVSDLQRAKAQLTDAPLAEEATALRQKQLLAEKSQTDIEKALIKSDASRAGGTAAKIKEYQEWVKDPRNTGKTYGDFLEWRAKTLSTDRVPATIAEFNRAREDGFKGTYEEWLERKSAAGAKGRETGQAQGQAVAAIPKLDAVVDEMTLDVEKLKKHPGIDRAVGLMAPLPNIPGGSAADFNALLGRLKGQAFLQQFEVLKGAGAITEMEGKTATDALAALSTSQSKKQFLEQLDTVVRVINKGKETLRTRAGQGASAAPPAAAPSARRRVTGPDGKMYDAELVDGKWIMEPVQ
jgi:hypothetical protein